MGYTNTLCNPTPFDAVWDWSRGIVIKVPAFSEVELTDIQMVDDFRPGKPGSENVEDNMRVLGIFLRDPNRSYDSQALETLQGAVKEYKARLQSSTTTLRSLSATTPGFNENNFEEILRQHGLDMVKNKIAILEGLAKQYQKAVDKAGTVTASQGFDPERTIFVMNPPKEFASKTAMESFLAMPDNAELRVEHDKFMKKLEAKSKKGAAPDEATVGV